MAELLLTDTIPEDNPEEMTVSYLIRRYNALATAALDLQERFWSAEEQIKTQKELLINAQSNVDIQKAISANVIQSQQSAKEGMEIEFNKALYKIKRIEEAMREE